MNINITSVKEITKTFRRLLSAKAKANGNERLEIEDEITDYFMDVICVYGYSFRQARWLYQKARAVA